VTERDVPSIATKRSILKWGRGSPSIPSYSDWDMDNLTRVMTRIIVTHPFIILNNRVSTVAIETMKEYQKMDLIKIIKDYAQRTGTVNHNPITLKIGNATHTLHPSLASLVLLYMRADAILFKAQGFNGDTHSRNAPRSSYTWEWALEEARNG